MQLPPLVAGSLRARQVRWPSFRTSRSLALLASPVLVVFFTATIKVSSLVFLP